MRQQDTAFWRTLRRALQDSADRCAAACIVCRMECRQDNPTGIRTGRESRCAGHTARRMHRRGRQDPVRMGLRRSRQGPAGMKFRRERQEKLPLLPSRTRIPEYTDAAEETIWMTSRRDDGIPKRSAGQWLARSSLHARKSCGQQDMQSRRMRSRRRRIIWTSRKKRRALHPQRQQNRLL